MHFGTPETSNPKEGKGILLTGDPNTGNETVSAYVADNGKTNNDYYCAVHVIQYVTGISLDKTTLTMRPQDIEELTYSLAPYNAVTIRDVAVSSDKTGVVTVEKTSWGKVKLTAVGNGTAHITATSTGTRNGSPVSAICTVTVTGESSQSVDKVIVSPTEMKVTLSADITPKSLSLDATTSPSSAVNKQVTWTSSNMSVAQPDEESSDSLHITVLCKSAGEAILTATTKDGNKTATCKVTVSVESAVKPVKVVISSDKVKSGSEAEIKLTTSNVNTLTGKDTNSFETSGNNVLLSKDIAEKAAKSAGGELFDRLPVFALAAPVSTDVYAACFELKGSELGGAKKASEIKLLKTFTDGTGKPFEYATEADYGDGKFALLDASAKDYTGEIASGNTYTLALFIKPKGAFDISTQAGTIVDPTTILKAGSTPTPPTPPSGGSSGGCAAGFGALALMALVPAVLRRKK